MVRDRRTTGLCSLRSHARWEGGSAAHTKSNARCKPPSEASRRLGVLQFDHSAGRGLAGMYCVQQPSGASPYSAWYSNSVSDTEDLGRLSLDSCSLFAPLNVRSPRSARLF